MFYLIQLLNAIQYGLLLFLLSSGLTLIFGIIGVINLAHGSFYMIGAYLAYLLAKTTGSLWLALPLVLVMAFAIGWLLETSIFSRLYRRDHLYQVLLTFGLILIFEELRSIVFGDDVHGVARAGIRAVEKYVDPTHVPIDEACRGQGGLRRLQVAAPQQQVHVPRVAHRSFINPCYPRRHRIPARNGVGHSVRLQSLHRPRQPLAHFLHGPDHPFPRDFAELDHGLPPPRAYLHIVLQE